MQRIFFHIFFFALLNLNLVYAQSTSGIKFETGDFASWKAKANAEAKIIFLDAYTTWCGPCKWMAKNTFTKPEIGDFFNKTFVNTKMDMEKGEGIAFAKEYNIKAYPTLLFLDGNGRVVHRSTGALNPEQLMNLAQTALNPEKNLLGLTQKFQSNPASPEMAFAYLNALYDGDLPELNSELSRHFDTQPKENWSDRNHWRMINEFLHNPEHPVFQYFESNREVFARKYGSDSVDSKLKSVYFEQLEQAAYDEEAEQWAKFKQAIERLKLSGSDEVIARTSIYIAGEDRNLANLRIMEYMKKYGSDDPRLLNQFAWSVCSSSADKTQLAAAEGWAKKALDANPQDPYVTDTYAHILFKNGKISAAKTAANKALELGKKVGADVSGTEELLQNIKTAESKAGQKGSAKKPVKAAKK